jgi:hypothetical protein
MLFDTHSMLDFWQNCYRLIGVLEKTLQAYSNIIDDRHDLPEDLLFNFLELWRYIYTSCCDMHISLREIFRNYPNIRLFLLDGVLKDKEEEGLKCAIVNRIRNVIEEITGPGDPPPDCYRTVLDLLETLIESHPAAKTLISPLVSSSLSNVSIATECIH